MLCQGEVDCPVPRVMAAKWPTREVLPTLDELVADRDRDKLILDEMKKTFEVLKEARMEDLST